MSKTKHIVIVAGEESGDAHAAELIKQLQITHPGVEISGIGGQHMKDAGAEIIFELASYGVTGISEVLKHFKIIKKAFDIIKQHLNNHPPDLLILVDYPGFNLRLAKYAKRTLGLRIMYYISPQIWAWKANRIHLIRECIDRMAVIFPFEKAIYETAGVPVSFVGHPLVNKINPEIETHQAGSELGLPSNKKIIGLLPGSRHHEIKQHMPVFIASIKQLATQLDDLHFVIPIADTLNLELFAQYLSDDIKPLVTLVKGHAIRVICSSDCVVVASGTASLECALLEKPMCIVYKSSLITYLAASQFIKVKYLGLCNLLVNQMIVPELLQYDFNAEELTKSVRSLLVDQKAVTQMRQRLHHLKNTLSSNSADCTLVQLVASELQLVPRTSFSH